MNPSRPVSKAIPQPVQTHWARTVAEEALDSAARGGLAVLKGLSSLLIPEAQATPQYARQTGSDCTACHVVPPKLNQRGEVFLARGYRMASEAEGPKKSGPLTTPLAAWLTARHERQISKDFSESYLPKVEVISGGSIGDSFSYFVEWRPVSLSARADGTLQDRGGRFEDAFLNWQRGPHTVRTGQFRPLAQLDVSRRLSVSEPVLFSASLPGEPSGNKRIASLRGFSPSGRSPGAGYAYQSLTGRLPSDGLFHGVTVMFPGEFSLPLSPEARREASFELEAGPKGVFLETFYRKGLNSVGVHAILDNNRWLVSGLAMLHYGDLYAAAGLGREGGETLPSRNRYSLEAEYLPAWFKRFRPGVGARVEQISNAQREPAFIPYLILSGPNAQYAFQLQAEGRLQKDNTAFVLDLSTIF